jgi:hypothetical protein
MREAVVWNPGRFGSSRLSIDAMACMIDNCCSISASSLVEAALARLTINSLRSRSLWFTTVRTQSPANRISGTRAASTAAAMK